MEAVLYVEGEIVSEINEFTTFPCTLAADIRNQLLWQKDNAKYSDQTIDTIRVIINTPGGSANAGNAIYDMLAEEEKAGIVVNTYGIGVVASIGTKIFSKGRTRQLSKHCKFFIHLPAGGYAGTADGGLAYFEAVKNLENELIATYESLGLTLSREELLKLCQDETELTAEQARDYGFATAVAEEVTAHKKGVLTDLPIKKEKMNVKEKQEANTILDELKVWFRDEVKNMFGTRKEVKALKLTDTNTNTDVIIETDGDVVEVGQKATDADGNALADGTYTLSNDQVITVVDGLITAVEAKPNEDEVENLKAELEKVTAERDDLKKQLEEVNAKHTQELEEVQAKAQTEIEAKVKPMEEKVAKLSKLIGSTGTVPRDDNRPEKEEKKNEEEDPGKEALRRNQERKAKQNKK